MRTASSIAALTIACVSKVVAFASRHMMALSLVLLAAEESKVQQQSLNHVNAQEKYVKKAAPPTPRSQTRTSHSVPALSHPPADVHVKVAKVKMEEEKAEEKVKQAKVGEGWLLVVLLKQVVSGRAAQACPRQASEASQRVAQV